MKIEPNRGLLYNLKIASELFKRKLPIKKFNYISSWSEECFIPFFRISPGGFHERIHGFDSYKQTSQSTFEKKSKAYH